MRNRPAFRLAIALGVVSAQGCHRSSRSEEPTGAMAPADSIVLERTLCYGTCPAYRLRVAGSGHVAFESRNPGDSGRVASGRVTPDRVAGLLVQADKLGFDSLPEIIANDRRFCPDNATDHPTATITVFRRAATKRVEDYLGCFAKADHSVTALVAQLRAFEKSIDSAAGSERWVQPARGR
jgi:hypothetical protein